MRAIILATVVALWAGPIAAADCFPANKIAAILATQYDETLHTIGATGSNMMMIYTSPKGTWTMLVQSPNGEACIAAAGTGFYSRVPGIPS